MTSPREPKRKGFNWNLRKERQIRREIRTIDNAPKNLDGFVRAQQAKRNIKKLARTSKK